MRYGFGRGQYKYRWVSILFCFVAALFFLPSLSESFSQDIEPFSGFNSSDRILILAPHPDDEVIATAGVIQEAVSLKLPVKIVYLTYGDNNEPAFIVYEKHIVFKKKAFVSLGEVRRKESINAVKFLGLKEDDLIFFGYPDFGTLQIFTKYWNTKKPYRSMLTRVTEVPYPEALSPGAPYVGESILKDLGKVITDFKPTKIFVSHPADVNRDHRALNLFLRAALWDLEGKLQEPEVICFLVHVVRWPMPRGSHPEVVLDPPKELKDSGISWRRLELSKDRIAKKKKAISFFKSQIEYAPSYLYTFVRRNELFGDYPVIRLKDNDSVAEINKLGYARKDGCLLVKIDLKKKIDKYFGISVFLFGYSKVKDFALMPKINITIGMRGLKVKDKFKRLLVKDVQAAFRGHSMVLKVPLSLLGEPDRILATARTSAKDLTLDDTALRVIELNY
jgi:LmbE family N-acetylglucosaminyl deacetylase